MEKIGALVSSVEDIVETTKMNVAKDEAKYKIRDIFAEIGARVADATIEELSQATDRLDEIIKHQNAMALGVISNYSTSGLKAEMENQIRLKREADLDAYMKEAA